MAFTNDQEYDIQNIELNAWRSSDLVIEDLVSGMLLIGDGTSYKLPGAEAVNFLIGQTVSLSSTLIDQDTGGLTSSPKYAPTGWYQKIHEIEFESSKLNSIHDKNWLLTDFGYGSLKFYDSMGSELTTQQDIDASCVRTDLEWMPTHDYMIKGGVVAQLEIPTEDFYVWVQAVVLPLQLGGPQATFCDGGLNMKFVAVRDRIGIDGVAGTVLKYNHPQLGDGAGTNKIRFVTRHGVGVKHRIQVVLNIFSE